MPSHQLANDHDCSTTDLAPWPLEHAALLAPLRSVQRDKTTTEDDDAATLHHACILEFFIC